MVSNENSSTFRRMGEEGSANWLAMLNSAEAILREEGHAALTSRKVADRIGLKQRLVYYYFRSMDDLVIRLFRHMAERELAHLQAAAAGPKPLRALWDIKRHSTDCRLISEFMALAHRIAGLKREVVQFIETSREIEMAVLTAAARRQAMPRGLDPAALALASTGLALLLSREAQLGVTLGHAEITATLEALLDTLEPLEG